MRSLLTLVFISICAIPCAADQRSAAPAKSEPSAKDICVLVRGRAGEPGYGPVGTAVGSGFYVAPDLVLTCNHLTRIPLGYDEIPVDAMAIEGAAGRMVEAKVVRRDTAHDLVLLKVEEKSTKEPLCVASSCAREGDALRIIGNFPDAVRVTRGEVISDDVEDGFAMADAKVRSGFSGGPVVDANNRVQGILSQRDDDNNAIYVKADVIRRFLKSYEKKAGVTIAALSETGGNTPATVAAPAITNAVSNPVIALPMRAARGQSFASNTASSFKVLPIAAANERMLPPLPQKTTEAAAVNWDQTGASAKGASSSAPDILVVAVPIRHRAN